jgi:hypothetical protein
MIVIVGYFWWTPTSTLVARVRVVVAVIVFDDLDVFIGRIRIAHGSISATRRVVHGHGNNVFVPS